MVIYFFLYYNNQIQSVLGIPFITSLLLSKIIIHMFRVRKFRVIVYGSVLICCLLTFRFFSYDAIKWLNINFRILLIKITGFDLVSVFEKFIFVGKNKDDYIEIIIIRSIKKALISMKVQLGIEKIRDN